jgi:DNA-binding NarL/FixJ family response regulator
MTRVLIADSHPVVRFGLRSIIESRAGWTVVAEATDGIEATDGAIVTQPDVAILDYALPVLNGIEATHQIRRRVPNVEVLIFTMHDNEDLVRQAFNAGARAYVLKSEAQQQLVSAIEALAMHRRRRKSDCEAS